MIAIGTQLDTLIRGHHVRYRIAAIRRAPFNYVELEPVNGGPRRQLPMYVAERIPHVDTDHPSPADVADELSRSTSEPRG